MRFTADLRKMGFKTNGKNESRQRHKVKSYEIHRTEISSLQKGKLNFCLVCSVGNYCCS